MNFRCFTGTQTSEYLQKNREHFWNRFFAHCYQEHWQNEIYYKVDLSTLFPKRNTTFQAAFLLKESVLTFSQIRNYIWFQNNQKIDHLSCNNHSVWYQHCHYDRICIQTCLEPWTGQFFSSYLAISSLSGAIILWSIHLDIGTIPWTSGNYLFRISDLIEYH